MYYKHWSYYSALNEMIVLWLNAYCDVSQTNVMHIVFFYYCTVIYNTNLVQFNDDFMSVTTVKCNKCMIWLKINFNLKQMFILTLLKQ